MNKQQTISAVPPAHQHHAAKANGDPYACISAEDRREMIALGAYYRAESRGFAPGRDLEDWLEAESEIDDALGGDSPDRVQGRGS